MASEAAVGTTFHEGEEVVLVEGTYQGTRGVFMHLEPDTKWADIKEPDGTIRSHPMALLAHSAAAPSSGD